MNLKWARITPGNSTKLAWTGKMSVSNQAIDAEHQKLIGLVNEVELAIRTRNAAALSQVFALFEDSIREHFRNEAGFAQAINHPFDEHELEHRYVLGELRIMREELLPSRGGWSESAAEYYYSFLSEWAIRHISEDDMQMKAKLETYPYDFIPPDTPK